ncbi:MAG TPA: SRPBCC family protein [Aromatoleum sp.]|uniref:SRPBCC family protein n=1 Tax=Aromatoleum sp. TaxID=2307007 RepID=UPI002B48A74E|nr:SRPBCC family protein [Aromatoleum sp.]HJV24042.1 SRPBCC family protein [Aromatoleum sp.]
MKREVMGGRHGAMTALGVAGLSMLAMYLLDPQAGRRRRALVTDKLRSGGTQVGRVAEVAWRDGVNRSRGLAARVRSRMTADHDLSIPRLEGRVRARIGRAVSNPHGIHVLASDDGTVVLEGPILADEVGKLMGAVWSVRGVTKVDDRLDVHDEPGNIAALQGVETGRHRSRVPENWPPSLRMLAGGAGILTALLSLSRGRAIGALGTLAGGALVARSVTNQRLGEIAGRRGTRSVHLDKELFIAAPPEQVFDFWSHPENFPQFMRNVEAVQMTGANRWHWKVAGPLRPVEWDAEIVERDENRRLVWRTLPGAAVESEGSIDFEPDGSGTRLRVSMSYTPKAGIAGHAVARLFGRDAKTQLDEDLMRVKSFLETGMPARDAHATRQAESERTILH